jgi:hypothetical protein
LICHFLIGAFFGESHFDTNKNVALFQVEKHSSKFNHKQNRNLKKDRVLVTIEKTTKETKYKNNKGGTNKVMLCQNHKVTLCNSKYTLRQFHLSILPTKKKSHGTTLMQSVLSRFCLFVQWSANERASFAPRLLPTFL